MLKIVTAPDSVLSQKAESVRKINRETLELIEEMRQTLLGTKDPIGVGLAAPQIGKSLRIILVKPTPKSEMLTCINPQILSKSDELKPLKRPKNSANKRAGTLEGCLSLPTIWGTVLRSPKIKLQYLDENGKKHAQTFTNFTATIVQHEIDHLDGIIFPARVLEQKARLPSGQGKLYKSHKSEEGEDEFEEIEL